MPPTTTPGQREEGCAGWSYREVLPYFKRAEDNQRFADDYHGYGGPLGVSDPDRAAADLRGLSSARRRNMGIPYNPDFNGASQEGVGYYQLTQRNARRSSAVGRLSQADPRPAEPDGQDRRPGHARSSSRAAAPSASRSSRAAARRPCCARARGAGHLGRHRLAEAAAAVRHRPGRPSEGGRRAGRARPAGRRLEPAGPSRPLRHRRMHRRPHLRQLRQAAPTRLGRAPVPPVQDAARSPRPCSRPAASGTPTRPRARPTSSSISASARASRPASRS